MMLTTALRAHWLAADLDVALASGADPASAPELAARARFLRRRRRGVSDRLLDAVRDPLAQLRCGPGGTYVPYGIACSAGHAVRALADELKGVPDPSPRGLARASLLVSDRRSPLYTGPTIDAVLEAVRGAREAL